MSKAHSIEAVGEDRNGSNSRQASEDPEWRSGSTTRVFIADDQPFLRRGLHSLISNEPDMEVCGEAAERSQALKVIKRLKPDVVVLELYLQDDETIGLIKQVRCLNRSVQIVVLSRHDELVFAVPSFKAGARAFVMKHEEPDCVIDAIRTVRKGDMRFSWEVSSLLLNRVTGHRPQGLELGAVALSPREMEVVTLIAAGHSSREIATRLEVSIKTVEAHRAHIKQKANLDNSTALVRYSMSVTNEIPSISV